MVEEHQIKAFCKKYLSTECAGTCKGCQHERAALEQIKPIGGEDCDARRIGRLKDRPWNCTYCGSCGDVR